MSEYDGFEGGDSDGGGPPRYDLAGLDLRPPRNADAACASVKAEGVALEKARRYRLLLLITRAR